MTAGESRARRLFDGWSANLVQAALIPVFLHYWSGEVLAGWLALYAAGNLASAADIGMMARAINRFLSLRSCADCNGRSAAYYAGMRRIYFALSAVLVAVLLAGAALWPPSATLAFEALPHFDSAFAAMVGGTSRRRRECGVIIPSFAIFSWSPTARLTARGQSGRASPECTDYSRAGKVHD